MRRTTRIEQSNPDDQHLMVSWHCGRHLHFAFDSHSGAPGSSQAHSGRFDAALCSARARAFLGSWGKDAFHSRGMGFCGLYGFRSTTSCSGAFRVSAPRAGRRAAEADCAGGISYATNSLQGSTPSCPRSLPGSKPCRLGSRRARRQSLLAKSVKWH